MKAINFLLHTSEFGLNHVILLCSESFSLIHLHSGHDDVVRTLIRLGADVDINEKSGWTPLMRVAFDGNRLKYFDKIKKKL